MSKRGEYEAKTESFVLPILSEHQFELVDIEYVKEGSTWYLRVFIDKDGGITVDDCELVARQMNEILDQEDYIAGQYVFEVSSPGLQRPLKKEKDYIRNKGKLIEVRTYRTINGEKEHIGILASYSEDEVHIVDENKVDHCFQRSDIALIRQAIDFLSI